MLLYNALRAESFLQGPGPRRVYGICGDAYLQKRGLDLAFDACLEKDSRDFNLDQLDGETTSIANVLGLCGNLPFLSERRVVVVRHAEKIEGLGKSEAGAEKPKKGSLTANKRLGDGLKDLPATTTLILVRTPETPEPGARVTVPRCVNAAIDKIIEDVGFIVDCTIPVKNASLAVSILREEARARGIQLPNAIAHYLVNRCGHDISRLVSEVEKCALSVEPGQPITEEVVNEMTQRAPHETVFVMLDAVGERQGHRALSLLRDLIDNGESPEQLLNMLARHLRQLLQARTCLDAGLAINGRLASQIPPGLAAQLPQDAQNLPRSLAQQDWKAAALAKQARCFTVPQLQSALETILAADLANKGIEGDGGFESKQAPVGNLEIAVARLCV